MPTQPTATKYHVQPRWFLTGGAFLSFFVFGFVDNLKGPTLPMLLADLDFDYEQGGTVLLGSYFGFLVATLISGPLADRAGTKSILVISGLCMCLGLVAIAVVNSFWLLFAAMFVMGLGMGSIEVGGNTMVVMLHGGEQGRYLNLLGLFHGIGAMSVPIYAGQLLARGVSWRQIFLYSLGIALLFLLYMLFLRLPIATTDSQSSFDWAQLRQKGLNRQMVLFYLTIALYVSAELGVASWMVEYLQRVKSFSVERSSLYLSLFFGFIIVGRLLGSFVVERAGYLRIMLVAVGASIGCMAIGIYGAASLAIFVPLTGLFFSIMFPTITAAVSATQKGNIATLFGLLFAFGGIGGMFGPWSIGAIGNRFGLQIGFALPIIYCALVMMTIALLYIQPTQENS